MGFRFYKRIGGRAGFNIGKSRISASVRGPFGSFGTSGFSIRTGVPGLTYRKYWGSGGSSRGGGAGIGNLFIAVWHIGRFMWSLVYLILLCYFLFFRWVFRMLARLLDWGQAAYADRQRNRSCAAMSGSVPARFSPGPPRALGKMAFKYVARSREGARVTGTIEATDRVQAIRALESRRLVPVSLEGGPATAAD